MNRVITLLIDTRFPHFYFTVNNFIHQINGYKIPVPDLLLEVIHLLENYRAPFRITKIRDLGEIQMIFSRLQELIEKALNSNDEVEIKFSTASSSALQTSGSISIAGRGTVSCHLHARNVVRYLQSQSMAKGDRIHGREIYLSEVGGPMGDSVNIEVTEHLIMKKVHSAVVKTPEWKRQIEGVSWFDWKLS